LHCPCNYRVAGNTVACSSALRSPAVSAREKAPVTRPPGALFQAQSLLRTWTRTLKYETLQRRSYQEACENNTSPLLISMVLYLVFLVKQPTFLRADCEHLSSLVTVITHDQILAICCNLVLYL
jgi:hypothetical protein